MSAPTLIRPSAGDAQAPRSGREPVTPKPFASGLAALSVLAGSVALSSILDGGEWVAPTVQIVGLVWLIGLGCRLLRVPAPLTVLAQAAGILVTLTAVFTSGGYGGLIPNARAVREASALLDGAWDQIVQSTVPAPATPELSFLVAISLGLIALIVDFFVSEVDAPALVALPLLCLYSVPASISEALLPWWAFALPAAGYAALVAVAGHPGRRVGLRAGIGVAVAGGLALVLAIGSSLLVADAITEVGTAGRLDRSGQGGGGNNIGLSAFASLHGDLVRGDSRDVLRVTGLPQPDYLRTTALEAWDPNQGFGLVDPDDGARDAGSPVEVSPLARNPAALPALVSVQILSFSDRFVPMYQGTSQITGLDDDYSYNPELGSVFRDGASRPQDYQLSIAAGAVPQEQLRQDGITATETLTAADGVSETARTLAQQVTADAQTPFDRALALTDYFTDRANGFTYDLQVPVGNSGDLLTDFLTNKRGYCEQYAAAMAVMLRTLGIPSRVAIGFTQGEVDPAGGYVIDSHDAHAWVEVRFDGAGWVRFDPTPLGQDIAGQQGFATSTAPASESSAAPSASVPTGAVDDIPEDGPSQTRTQFTTVTVAGEDADGSTPFWRPWMGWTVVVVALVAVLLAVPGALRRRRRDRRLAAAVAGGTGAPGAAWSEVEDLATDHGVSLDPGATIRKAANQLARDGKLTEGSRAGLRRIVLSAESSWYAPDGYQAPTAGAGAVATENRTDTDADLAADVRRIAVDLEHSSPRSLRDRVIPRSVLRRSPPS